jgi:hypothetical protein
VARACGIGPPTSPSLTPLGRARAAPPSKELPPMGDAWILDAVRSDAGMDIAAVIEGG